MIFCLDVTTTATTTSYCDTRRCLVLQVERCIPKSELCDGEKYCDDGTDEIPSLFPDVSKCVHTTGID